MHKIINFIEKIENPANLPEVRAIEDFWSNISSFDDNYINSYGITLFRKFSVNQQRMEQNRNLEL